MCDWRTVISTAPRRLSGWRRPLPILCREVGGGRRTEGGRGGWQGYRGVIIQFFSDLFSLISMGMFINLSDV